MMQTSERLREVAAEVRGALKVSQAFASAVAEWLDDEADELDERIAVGVGRHRGSWGHAFAVCDAWQGRASDRCRACNNYTAWDPRGRCRICGAQSDA